MALWLATTHLAVPYQRDYAEGIILEAAVRVAHDQTPYPPPSAPVFVFNVYGPVFYYLVSALVKQVGVGLMAPRLLILFSALLVAGFLSLLLRHCTRSWRVSLTFGFLYLMLPTVPRWLFLLRVDLTGIAFALGGLYLFAVFPRRWYLAVPLFVAAVYCKYTLVAAPLACFLFLLVRKERRKAAWFATSTALLAVLCLAWIQHATHGWFVMHMFWATVPPFSLLNYIKMMSYALLLSFPLVLLAMAPAIPRFRLRANLLALIYLAVCSLTALTVGASGAASNHLFEWWAALCLCAGLGYHALRTRSESCVPAALAAAVLTLFALLLLPRGLGPETNRAECNRAYEYVQRHPGKRILSENVGALVMAHKPVLLSDPFLYNQLVRRSGWSEAAVNNLVRARYFDAIILNGDIGDLRHKAAQVMSPISRWPLSFVNALEQNYRPTQRFICEDANVVFELR